LGIRAQKFEELGVTFGVVGQGGGNDRRDEVARRTWHVEAGIQDDVVVLTHTCRNASRVRGQRTRSRRQDANSISCRTERHFDRINKKDRIEKGIL
jgi:hypothetical protein